MKEYRLFIRREEVGLQTKSVWTELSDEVSDPFVMKV